MTPYSIYLHIPFCQQRCNYCDFNTYGGVLQRIPGYVDVLCKEIEMVSKQSSRRLPVHTVYLGGGTPSLLPIEGLQQILITLQTHFEFTDDMEITLEANPGTLSSEFLSRARLSGVNRLSIGMQSASNTELKLLGRIHKFEDVQQSMVWARAAGFDNISLDLIYGLPNQSLDQWNKNIQIALDLKPEHLSLYALTLETHVPMYRQIASGVLPPQDDDLEADMYELATDLLDEGGFAQYEISNWARRETSGRDLRSKHNLQYWNNQYYLGFGAGAHGYAEGVRTENLCRIIAYSERCCSKPAGEFPRGPALKRAFRIDSHREMQETMMLGLRLMQGVSFQQFQTRFGLDMTTVFGKEIEKLIGLHLLEESIGADRILRLTRHGRFLSNVVFREFVD